MPSATEAAKKRGKGSQNLLKGSDLPKSMRELTVTVKEAREAPEGFGSPLILDLRDEPVPDKTAIPLNITNTRVLVQLLGDDYSLWEGAQVTLVRIPVQNPVDGSNTWGLRVTDAKLARHKGPSKSARKVAAKTAAKDDDEVPF